MAVLVVSDIHANLEAFRSILADAQSRATVDAIWCLGDIVGYGPDPSACIELLRSFPNRTIAGNHDLAACGSLPLHDFNEYAAEAATWTAEHLTAAEKDWLRSLPASLTEADFTLVHGSLRDPVWEYLMSRGAVDAHLAAQRTSYGLVGHSHHCFVAYADGEYRDVEDTTSVKLTERRFVANSGSVGQPRDGDRRAAYALLDTEAKTLSFHRVEYDVAAVQAKMRAAGLPLFLSVRLSLGQ